MPLTVAPGTVFANDFRILRPLHSGGMGAVYVAHQISTGKPRALKLMHPQLVGNARLRERFEREARVGSLIQSEHVVQVIGAGVDSTTSAPWLAMELLAGQDLAAYLRHRGTLPVGEVHEVFRQLCHALSAAHAVGVVHRDIKPENIFLTTSQSAHVPTSIKVLDFGIAKLVADAHTTSTSAIGTPMWMAPEQTDPNATITPGVDVWALGLLGFLLLTGRVYWVCGDNPSAPMQAILREMLIEPLACASERAERFGLSEKIPAGFDAWFARCVDRDASARFADAGQLYEALREALPPSTVPAVSLPPPVTSIEEATAPTIDASTGPGLAHPTLKSPEEDARQTQLKKRRFRIGIAAGVASTLVVSGLAVFFATRAIVSRTDDPTAPATSQVLAPPTAQPTIDDPTPPSPLPSSTPTPERTADPTPSAVVSSLRPPKAAPKPERKPFDRGQAFESIDQATVRARAHCKHLDGPRAISVTLRFTSDGRSNVHIDSHAAFGTETAGCVRMVLGSVHVEPFFDDGKDHSVKTTIAMD